MLKTVDAESGVYVVRFKASGDDWNRLLQFVKDLPGRMFHPATREWRVPVNPSNTRALQDHGFVFTDEARLAGQPKTANNQKKLVPIDETKLVKLYPFQRIGVQFIETLGGNGIIGDDMGLGKTVQGIGYALIHPELRPALVVCPKSVKLGWARHVLEWMGETVEVLEGLVPRAWNSDASVYIINYDVLAQEDPASKEREKQRKQRLKAEGRKYRRPPKVLQGWVEILTTLNIKLLIGDEIHRVSDPDTIRTQAFKSIVKSSPMKKVFLSGTLMKDRPRDLFTALELLGLKMTRSQFLWRYCDPKHNGFGWKFDGLTNADELHNLLKTYMIRRLKRDVLPELPPKQKSIVPMELNPKALRQYRQLEEKTDPDTEISLSALRIAAFKTKRDAILEWVDDFMEIEQKLIIFTYHRIVIQDLMAALADYCPVMVDGSVTGKKRQDAIDAFQTNSKTRIFIGQIEAAGEGITLTAAFNLAFVEFGFTARQHEQGEDRGLRIGQESDRYLVYYLTAPGTCDDDGLEMISDKYDMSKQVLDGEKDATTFFQQDRNILSIMKKNRKKKGVAAT